MAITYKLIAKTVLSASTSSVTLSSIPSTYTHLKIFVSSRQTSTGLDAAPMYFNGGTSTASYLNGYFDSNEGGTPRSGAAGYYQMIRQPTNYASSVWAYNEILIPNYAGSNEKNIMSYFNTENSASNQYMGSSRTYTAVTSAITSVTLGVNGGGDYVSGTSFYIYGLANT